jgi:hypothetical protein
VRKVLIVSALLAVMVAGAAFWWAQPLLALRNLKHALQSRDTNRVAALVDFDTLRANVIRHTDQKLDRANEDKFLGGVRSSIEKDLAAGKIESYATPEGFIHLVCDHSADGSVDMSPQPPGKPCVLDGKLQRAGYENSSHFQVVVRRSQGSGLRLMLARENDAWKVVNLADASPAK